MRIFSWKKGNWILQHMGDRQVCWEVEKQQREYGKPCKVIDIGYGYQHLIMAHMLNSVIL